MAHSTAFGALVGSWDVEQAVVSTIATWLDTYLTEIERNHGLDPRTIPRPPEVDCVYGGTDFNSWQQDFTPAVIVVVNPLLPPELSASAGYGQSYEVQVGAVLWGDSEEAARMQASHYAAAIAGTLIQRGGLGGIATRTTLALAPSVVMPDPDQKRLANGVCTVNVFVQPILDEKTGPLTPDPVPPTDSAEPPDWPRVTHITTEVIAERIDE